MSYPTSLQDFTQFIDNIDHTSFTAESDRTSALAAARSLCHRLERPMDTMLRIAWIEPSYVACLKIALDVGAFRALNEGGKDGKYSVEDMSKVTKTEPGLLIRVLRVLASMDTISEIGNGLFAATELSNALVQRPVNSCIDYRHIMSNPMFQNLPAFLKKTHYQQPTELLNSPWQYAVGTKLSCFEWIGGNPDALEVFTNHMAGYTSQRGTWEEVYPIESRIFRGDNDVQSTSDVVLVDLGGGSGHDLKRFAARFLPTTEEPRLILQDLPEVIDQAQKTAQLPRVIKAIPIDFTKESPVPGARAYYMHSVLHDWPDEEVREILKQMHPTLSKQTEHGCPPKLLLNEIVLPKTGVQPRPAALDMIMMAAFASHERSEEQWAALLESSGYRITAIFSEPHVDEAVIEAEAISVP